MTQTQKHIGNLYDLQNINNDKNNDYYPISPSSWLSQLKNLTKPKTEIKDLFNQLQEKLSDLEKVKHVSIN